jgi:SAM-dependent methyltransferase
LKRKPDERRWRFGFSSISVVWRWAFEVLAVLCEHAGVPRQMWKAPLIGMRDRRHAPGRERVPEPMVMNEPESVAQFHAGGVSSPGMQAVYDFSARSLNTLLPDGARLLDLGVGSGRALAYLARLRPDVEATAVDLAPNMLAAARGLFEAEGLDSRIELVEADITALPDSIVDAPWDGISCVWTLHQLPDFEVLRGALRQIAAVRERTAAAVWIFDFQRLLNPDTFPALLDVLDPSMTRVLRGDGIASEAAAFTHEELSSELGAVGLGDLRAGHARPIPWCQAFWAPRADERPGGSTGFRPDRLPRRARGDAFMLRSAFSAKPF